MQITTPTPVEIPVTPYDALGIVAQHWHQELALIQRAPVLSIATILILAALAYLINRLVFQSTISGLRAHVGQLDARIEFQAEKLKDAERQAGALAREELPEQFKTKVQYLEQSLQKMQVEFAESTPRGITSEQRKRFADAIAGTTLIQNLAFFCNTIDPECESFARLLVQMFRDSGLRAGFGHAEENLPSDQGLLLVVSDTDHLTPEQQKLSKALAVSNITHRVVKNPRNNPPSVEFYYFLVGKKLRVL